MTRERAEAIIAPAVAGIEETASMWDDLARRAEEAGDAPAAQRYREAAVSAHDRAAGLASLPRNFSEKR